jgi:hypothetical protein
VGVPERFNTAVATLLADRSPAPGAGGLDLTEQRMLLLAQRIRGSRGQGPDPSFVDVLRVRLRRRISLSTLSVRDRRFDGR